MINQPYAFSLTGKIRDCGHTKFSCDVCGRETRFAWIAVSRKSDSDIEIRVGHECAKLIFNPFSTEKQGGNGDWVDENSAKLIQESKFQRLLSIVLTLKDKEPSLEFGRIIQLIKGKEALSPGQAGLITSLIVKHEMKVDPDVLKVKMNTGKAKDQLLNMKPWLFKTLHAYLRPNQAKIAEKIHKRKKD